MARVTASIEETDLESDTGATIPGLIVTCHRCGHSVEVYGTEAVSARRGGVMLREECPEGAHNFYVVEEGNYEDTYEEGDYE